jgi:coatomer subunit zeta
VYKFTSDLLFYVTSSEHENEIVVSAVLQALFESISMLLRGITEKRTALENLDLVLLAIDELIDGGVILETDPNVIASRVSMRGVDGEVPITEQSFIQAFASAREQISRNLLR